MNDIEIKTSGDYETKSGLHVEILRTDLVSNNGFCVVGIITGKTGLQSVHCWQINGRYHEFSESNLDLVEKELWIECFKFKDQRGVFSSNHSSHDNAIASINKSFAENSAYILVSLQKENHHEND